jgi:hypothetical protein
LGCAFAFRIAPGQAHELPDAIPLLDRLPGVPAWVVADRGYSSHSFREHIWSIGAKPAIPAKSNEAPVACPDWIDNNRNVVERSGPGSKSGERLQRATRRPAHPSWECSASPQQSAGSSANRP